MHGAIALTKKSITERALATLVQPVAPTLRLMPGETVEIVKERALEWILRQPDIRKRNEPVPASFPLGRKWFVVSVWNEAKAVDELDKLGFPTFNPTQTVTWILRGRKVTRPEPVFPGYVFASFDREREDWGAINDQDSVIGIVEQNSLPCRMPDMAIEHLKNWVAAGVFEKETLLQPGQAVEITEGPFAGLLAKVRSASPRKRARVLIAALGVVDIDTCFLRKA